MARDLYQAGLEMGHLHISPNETCIVPNIKVSLEHMGDPLIQDIQIVPGFVICIFRCPQGWHIF